MISEKWEVLKPCNIKDALYWGWRSCCWWERALFPVLAIREYWRYFRMKEEDGYVG